MVRVWRLGVLAAAAFVALAAGQRGTGPVVLAIDAANSRVLIQVGKTGLFGFAGHAHEIAAPEVRGSVRFDPADLAQASVSLEFAAAALTVTGTGEPPGDVAEVQKVMRSERVLDVARFPTVAFSSRRVAITSQTTGAADVVIDGDLTVHGTTRPVTVRARVTLDGGRLVTARGSFVMKQTDFGMVPVTAGGGTIRVKDELEIQFVLRTRPVESSRPERTSANDDQ
jgi:polyisoprenoid-binding protein YceI